MFCVVNSDGFTRPPVVISTAKLIVSWLVVVIIHKVGGRFDEIITGAVLGAIADNPIRRSVFSQSLDESVGPLLITVWQRVPVQVVDGGRPGVQAPGVSRHLRLDRPALPSRALCLGLSGPQALLLALPFGVGSLVKVWGGGGDVTELL